jgi:hypothetical protein
VVAKFGYSNQTSKNMRKGTKQTIFWILAAVAVIIVVFVLMNLDSFTQGFEAGSQLAE